MKLMTVLAQKVAKYVLIHGVIREGDASQSIPMTFGGPKTEA